jgi:hypothetical protein
MKRIRLIATLLILFGIAAFVCMGIITSARGRVFQNVGALDTVAEAGQTIPPPSSLALLAVAGGIALLIASRESGTN